MKLRILHLVFLFLITIIVSILKIPIVNEILSFITYSTIPGFLIYNLIMRKIAYDSSTDLYLSLCLSLIFIMVSLLLLNVLVVNEPLTALNIMLTVNIFISLLFIPNVFIRDWQIILRNSKKKTLVISLTGILLTSCGLLILNYYGNQLLMWISTAFVIFTIIYVIIKNDKLADNTIKLLLFAISLILLLSTSMITNHLMGWDIHREYAVFESTYIFKEWKLMPIEEVMSSQRINQFESYNANPSITLLPTFYANIFNLPNNEYIYKFFFQFFNALIPVILFDLFKKNFSKICSTIACIFIVIQFPFFQVLPTLIRQGVAYLFFVTLFLLIFSDMKNKVILSIILFFGILVSHYTTITITLIFLVLGQLLYLCLSFVKRVATEEEYIFFTSKKMPIFFGVILTLTSLWFVLVPTNLWYIFHTIRGVSGSILGEAHMETQVSSGLGLENLTFISRIGSIIGNLTRLFVLLGFLKVIYDFLKTKLNIDKKIIIFSIISFLLVISLVVFPSLADNYNLNRLYLNVLFFVAPLLFIGANAIFNKLSKNGITFIILLILVHFLFQEGIISYFTSESNHPFFDVKGDSYSYHAILESDLYAMEYLSKNILSNESVLINGLNEHNKISQYLQNLNPEKLYYKKYTDSLWGNVYYYNDSYSFENFDYAFENKTKNNLIYTSADTRIFFLRGD